MDRRQIKTRKAVMEAFEQLLAEKKYEDITVQDIIDRADIGRSTFYSHFETKQSLLDALCTDLFDHIFEEHLTQEHTHDFSGSDYSRTHMLTHILYHLKEDKERYGRLFSGESAELFWSLFTRQFEEQLMHQVKTGRWKMNPDLPEDLYLRLFVTSFVEVVHWWFLHGCAKSPEVTESYFERFLKGSKKNEEHVA